MRKIEFRARWRDTNKPIEDFSEQYIIDACNDDALIVEQYTGLKDIDGNEIYEGDILTDKDKNTTIVVWIDEWAIFGCMFHDEWELYRLKGIKEIDESTFWTFPIENNHLKVVGNIHENADLFSERSVKADA